MIHEINWTQSKSGEKELLLFLVTMPCDLFVVTCECMYVCARYLILRLKVSQFTRPDDRAYAGNSLRERWMQGERESEREREVEMAPILRGWVGSSERERSDDGMCRVWKRSRCDAKRCSPLLFSRLHSAVVSALLVSRLFLWCFALELFTTVKLVYEVRVCEWMNLFLSLSLSLSWAE